MVYWRYGRRFHYSLVAYEALAEKTTVYRFNLFYLFSLPACIQTLLLGWKSNSRGRGNGLLGGKGGSGLGMVETVRAQGSDGLRGRGRISGSCGRPT